MSIAREFVKHGLINGINFIVPGTEDGALQEIEIILSKIDARIDRGQQCIQSCTTHICTAESSSRFVPAPI
jgi:hypothetical protein